MQNRAVVDDRKAVRIAILDARDGLGIDAMAAGCGGIEREGVERLGRVGGASAAVVENKRKVAERIGISRSHRDLHKLISVRSVVVVVNLVHEHIGGNSSSAWTSGDEAEAKLKIVVVGNRELRNDEGFGSGCAPRDGAGRQGGAGGETKKWEPRGLAVDHQFDSDAIDGSALRGSPLLGIVFD